MPERKSHVKSRLGCSQCKSRRVKCDEVRPACGNCKRRQEGCSYTNPRPLATPSPDSTGFDQANGVHQLHLRQLELMHQYSTSTWETLHMDTRALDTNGVRAYRIEVPRLALSHEFLLDSVFAITSLHLAYLRPLEARSYIADATQYHTRALASCRVSLSNISASECMAMYYTSAKLGILALAFRAVDPDFSSAQKPTETLSQLSALWHGTWSIINASKDLMDEETHKLFFPKPDWDMRTGSVLGAQGNIFLDKLREKARAETPSTDEMTDVDASAIYLETIDQLQLLMNAYELEYSRVLAWIVIVPPQFIDFLVTGQPLANAIVLLYSVVFREMDQYWWARNFRRSLVNELGAAVASADPELIEMVNWVEGWTRPMEESIVPLGPDEVAATASWADAASRRSSGMGKIEA